MEKRSNLGNYILLFLPWLFATIFQSSPILSFFIAWGGSIFIFIVTMSGWIKPIPSDLEFSGQLMRPIFLIQIIFGGYMCLGSIFYLASLLGYVDFAKVTNVFFKIDPIQLSLTAQCQRYYVLGHAAFVTGILSAMNYPVTKKYYIELASISSLLLKVAFLSLLFSYTIGLLPGFTQFYYQFTNLSFIAGTLALAFAIPQKKALSTIICSILYMLNFYRALTSGFKEPIIISVLVLGIFLYPSYKKVVLVIFIPILLILFTFLPKFNQVFRESAWKEGVDVADAYELALDAAIEDEETGHSTTNWDFLTGRLTEINMFTQYIESTPKHINYYGFDLIGQSLVAIIPREFWQEKPLTERLIMQRVYAAGITTDYSNVSAKPAFIVDGYLSFGIMGIVVFLYLYGYIAQRISLYAEYLFGGYTVGTALVFSGLFQSFWRGLSLEFMTNSVFYSFISMLTIFWIMKQLTIIKRV